MNEEQNNNSSTPLDSLKNEIAVNVNNDRKKSLSWSSVMITVVLAILTFISLAQMVTAMTVFNKLKDNDIQSSTGVPQNNSLEALPDMVGGC